MSTHRYPMELYRKYGACTGIHLAPQPLQYYSGGVHLASAPQYPDAASIHLAPAPPISRQCSHPSNRPIGQSANEMVSQSDGRLLGWTVGFWSRKTVVWGPRPGILWNCKRNTADALASTLPPPPPILQRWGCASCPPAGQYPDAAGIRLAPPPN